tara:strand:+ start:65 stop:583 length:519 start_codon:yes stop_codon:yes gene_type:complete
MSQTQVERLFIKDRTSLVGSVFRLNTNVDITGPATTTITSNLEAVDAPTNFGLVGTAMSQSSGIFTFPSTGIYSIKMFMSYERRNTNSEYCGGRIYTTTDNNSSSNLAALSYSHMVDLSGASCQAQMEHIFDVTNTSTHKCYFQYECYDDAKLKGNTARNATYFKFIKLGDT